VKRENFLVHVVDSDQAIADGLAILLSTYGIRVLSYPDAESFLKFWLPRRACNCCLITEADLPGQSGPALLRELNELHVHIPVLMLVSTASPELIEVARDSGRIDVVQKPCLDHTLIDRVLSLRGESGAGRTNVR
jgi:FixJ family two-component response regulator